jgi:hypothetical protein
MEHLLASEYGWSIDYIHNLPVRKVNEHLLICIVKKGIEFEQMKARLI